MGATSTIEWTDATWTPIRARRPIGEANGSTAFATGWHCEHASDGCKFCYAESLNKRLGTQLPFKPGHLKDVEIFLDEKMLTAPLRWKKPRTIFVCSMTDLFARFVTDEMLDRVFEVIEAAETDYVNETWIRTPLHTFQILTKRSDRMREYMTERFAKKRAYADAFRKCPTPEMRDSPAARWSRLAADPAWYPNIWFGVSVEDQANANVRIPDLINTPAAVRFLSCEPLLGPVSIIDAMWSGADWETNLGGSINWVIAGGESGRSARPMHPDWARSLRDQCASTSTPFLFKQWGEWAPETNPDRMLSVPPARRDWLGSPAWDEAMLRVGKKAAGRLLDGIQHDGMPS